MKKLFTLLTLLTLLLVSFNYVYASEAYKANLNDISSTRESMKSTARILMIESLSSFFCFFSAN
jgi:hypothetical protein